MSLPRPLTHTHKFSNCPTPKWQVSPMTAAERSEIEALVPVLERRLVTAEPAAARKLVADALKATNPSALDDSSAAWIAALVAGYSLDTLAASIKFCGVADLKALADDLRKRRDNAEEYLVRAQILLGKRPPRGWWEISGAQVPDGPDKPFDKPVFKNEKPR